MVPLPSHNYPLIIIKKIDQSRKYPNICSLFRGFLALLLLDA